MHRPALLASLFTLLSLASASSQDPHWDRVPAILARIAPPAFPARDVLITDHGAVADGKTDAGPAIRQAIAACAAQGGGRVVVPAGEFLTGPIHLRSNICLHLASEDSVLRFTTEPAAYLPVVPTRFEGMECLNYSPLIYARDAANVGITGPGILDGQSSWFNWWAWKGDKGGSGKPGTQGEARRRLVRMVEQQIPVEERTFGPGCYLRPDFINLINCSNVLIDGVRLRRAPMWLIHPVLCRNVTVRRVDIRSHGPNNDGCDPESCRDVLIEDCVFDTGDDCLAIKSGRNSDGRRINVPSEDIIIRRCEMRDGHGGVVIGSEVSGHCRNVFVENCTMDSVNLGSALRLKNNAVRGAVLENIFLRRCRVWRVKEALLLLQFDYEEGGDGPFPAVARTVQVEDVDVGDVSHLVKVTSFPAAEITGIALSRIRGSTRMMKNTIANAQVTIDGQVVPVEGAADAAAVR